MQNDISREYIFRKDLEFHSQHDPLTNIYNIRYFKSKMAKVIKNKTPIAIAMFDVDHFKVYNDTHGHPAGDVVLKIIGETLQDCMRKTDLFARYGGEEFIICFQPIEDVKEAKLLAEQFRRRLEDLIFYGETTQPNGNITISIGVSHSFGNQTLEQMIEEADQALYEAKKAGRNCVKVYLES